jgi:hypothetical protein
LRTDALTISTDTPLIIYIDTFIFGGRHESSLESDLDRDMWITGARSSEVHMLQLVVTANSSLENNRGDLPPMPFERDKQPNKRLAVISSLPVKSATSTVTPESYTKIFTYLKQTLPDIRPEKYVPSAASTIIKDNPTLL